MKTHANQSGVMLLEVLIGILIFSVGIVAMLGMQATAMRATVDAKYRTEASFLANEIIGQMWVDRANLALYNTPSSCPGGKPCAWIARVQDASTGLPNATGGNAPTITVAGSQVTVTVRWRRPGDTSDSNHVATATINGS
jgi:type IV pilus assembly protein PilV